MHRAEDCRAAHARCFRPRNVPTSKALAAAFALVTVFALMAPCLSGCRASDALTEVIYDQTSQNIDYDNENKFLINDSTAEKKDSSIPAQESNHSGRVTEEKQNIVVYSSNPNAPQFTAKKSVWSKDPDFTGIEASEKVRFYESDDPDATEQDIQTPPEPEPEEEEETPPQQNQTQVVAPTENTDEGSGGIGTSSERGEDVGNAGETPSPKESTTGGGSSKEDDNWEEVTAPADETGGDPDPEQDPVTDDTNPPDDNTPLPETQPDQPKAGDTPAPVKRSSDNFTELPEVEHIAAVGQAAVVVQMIGGQGALVAADADLLNSEFSNVFSDEGSADIKVAWSDDGSAECIDMDAIEESGAQLLVVTDPDFTNSLSSEASTKLNLLLEKGTIRSVLYADLANTSALKKFVTKIGASLKNSTTIGQAGRTEQNANDYISFHDSLVSACVASNGGGGLAFDALNGDTNVYELGGNAGMLSTGEQLGFNGNAKFTLLVDEWDSSARYIYDEAWNPTMTGLALSKVGYADSPVSYYIQAGGLVNNAAARGNASEPGLYPVWQFASLPVLKDAAYVSYEIDGPFDRSVTPTKRRSGTAWDTLLLATSQNASGSGGNAPTSYGTTQFPKIIAANQTIYRALVDNSDEEGEAYHPYETLTDDVRGVRGHMLEDGTVYYTCIGAPGANEVATRTIGESIGDADIVVNPHGLFSSWTEYGSVEGVLEAAWINDVVNEDASALVDWKAMVEQFYATFYRYDSVDLSSIERGSVE